MWISILSNYFFKRLFSTRATDIDRSVDKGPMAATSLHSTAGIPLHNHSLEFFRSRGTGFIKANHYAIAACIEAEELQGFSLPTVSNL